MKKLLLVLVLLTSNAFATEQEPAKEVIVKEANKDTDSAVSKAYSYAISALDEYMYQPMLITFTEKSIMTMEISKLVKLLCDRINIVMIDFIAAGKVAKALQLNGATKQEIRDQQAKMAEIFYSLRAAEPFLRDMYPKLNNLFDQLIALRENLDYSIVDTDIIVKDPAEKTGILDKLLGR